LELQHEQQQLQQLQLQQKSQQLQQLQQLQGDGRVSRVLSNSETILAESPIVA